MKFNPFEWSKWFDFRFLERQVRQSFRVINISLIWNKFKQTKPILTMILFFIKESFWMITSKPLILTAFVIITKWTSQWTITIFDSTYTRKQKLRAIAIRVSFLILINKTFLKFNFNNKLTKANAIFAFRFYLTKLLYAIGSRVTF